MLIGDGPDRNDVERQAHGLGLAGKIVFAGFQSEIAPYYHAIDMLVLSSDREGHPMVALEAMASGRPVVATRVGGVPEVIVENENGKMVAPDNSEALAKALCHYVNDSEERRHHGLEAQKRVRDHFSVEAMVSQHELLYQEVLGEIEC
jgi:glycosyltransferase involved in cell wall biosynthesis